VEELAKQNNQSLMITRGVILQLKEIKILFRDINGRLFFGLMVMLALLVVIAMR